MSRVMVANLAPPVDQDLASIRSGEWPEREFPLGPRERPTRRSVIVRQSVLNDVYDHGRASPDIEVCGVLVGNVYQDAMGPFVFIEAGIRGNFSAGRSAQVTFTAKTWTHIQDVMDRQYPEMRILGWYHTHPGHGIFLSDMDLFIHKNFFSLPWHLALVFDPQHQEEGLFAWRSGSLAIESFVVQKDAPPAAKVARRVPEMPTPQGAVYRTAPGAAETRASDQGGAAVAASAAPRPVAAAAEVADLSVRIQTLERRLRWLTAGLALLVFLAVAWPIALSALTVLHAPQDLLPAWLAPKSSAADEPDDAADAPDLGINPPSTQSAPPTPDQPIPPGDDAAPAAPNPRP